MHEDLLPKNTRRIKIINSIWCKSFALPLIWILQLNFFCQKVGYCDMEHEYTDQPVTAWGGMKEMRELLDKTGISEKLSTLPLPISTSNNSIDAISIIESW